MKTRDKKGLLYSPFSFKDKKLAWGLWILSLFLVLGAMTVIYRFSAASAVESSQTSMGICRRLARWIAAYIARPEDIDALQNQLEIPIRKLAHFTEYACLGFLMQFHLYFSKKLEMGRNFVARGIAISVIYAISDEIHQYFVPGRACRFLDVCIDSSGVLVGTVIFCLIFCRLLDGLLSRVYN